MSFFNKTEKYITCPYDAHHQILESRMQFHLVKCKKVHSDADTQLVSCPFNNMHKVPAIELNWHRDYMCPDKKKVERFCYSAVNTVTRAPIENLSVEASENWDDVNHSTYNPAEYYKDKPILTQIQGATPSQRKQHKLQERQKMHNFNYVNEQSNIVENAQSTALESDGPARLPHSMSITLKNSNPRPLSKDADNNQQPEPEFYGRGRGRILKN